MTLNRRYVLASFALALLIGGSAQAAVLNPDATFGAQTLGSPIGAPWGPVSGVLNSAEASAQSPFTNVFGQNGIGANTPTTGGNPYIVGGFGSIPAAATGNLYFNVDFRNTSTESGDYSLVITDGASGAIRTAALFVTGNQLFAESTGFDPGASILTISPNTWYNAQLTLDLTSNTYSGTVTPFGGSPVAISTRGFVTENSIGTIYTDGGTSVVGGDAPTHDIDNFVIANAPLQAPAPAVGSQIVNVDFNGFRPGDVIGPTYVGHGAAGGGLVFNGIAADSVTGNNDNLSLAATNLLDSNGSPTTVAFQVSPVGGDVGGPATTDATSYQALFSDYVFDNSAANFSDSPFSITGLGAATLADLYFYRSSGDGTITVDGASSSAFSDNSIFTAGNTSYFHNVPVIGGVITGHFGNGTAVINGFTVVTVVPEPSTFVLLASAGVVGLMFVRRRRR